MTRRSRRHDTLGRGVPWHGLLVVVAVAAGLPAAAQPATPQALTLEGAVARAAGANPALRAARLETLAASARTTQAYAKHLGDADLLASASRYENARLVRPLWGPATPAVIGALPFDRDQLHYGLGWQIPLFAGGALIEGDRAARLAESAARASEARAVEELRYNVRAAYRGVLGLKHALAAAVAYEEALAHDDASARLRVETEGWAPADAAKVTFAHESAKGRAALLAAQLRNAKGLLAALMGDDPAVADYELADVDAVAVGVATTTPDLAAIAAERRTDLVAVRKTVEAQRARSAAVRAGFWPQVAFVGNYFLNDAPSVGAPIQTWELTLQLKIPLLADVGRTFAAREADAVAAASAERARTKELEIESQAVDAIGRLESARAALAAGTAQRKLGAEVVRVEELRFETGAGKVEDYLAARSAALEGETAYWLALYSLQSAYDYVELVSGTGGRP